MNTNYFPVHRSPPENTQWTFYRHIITDSRPSLGLFEYGPLRDRLEAQLGLFECGPLRNRLEALWGFGRRALLEPNRVLVSRGPGERLGPLFRGLYCSSPLGLGTRPYHLSLKPGDISYDVFGLIYRNGRFPSRLSFSSFVYRAIGMRSPWESFSKSFGFSILPIRIVRGTPVTPKGLESVTQGPILEQAQLGLESVTQGPILEQA